MSADNIPANIFVKNYNFILVTLFLFTGTSANTYDQSKYTVGDTWTRNRFYRDTTRAQMASSNY